MLGGPSNPSSSAFKFAGFCDVAQFLGWLACNLNLQFRIITFYQEEVEEGKDIYEDEEEEEEDEGAEEDVYEEEDGECSQEERGSSSNEELHLCPRLQHAFSSHCKATCLPVLPVHFCNACILTAMLYGLNFTCLPSYLHIPTYQPSHLSTNHYKLLPAR